MYINYMLNMIESIYIPPVYIHYSGNPVRVQSYATPLPTTDPLHTSGNQWNPQWKPHHPLRKSSEFPLPTTGMQCNPIQLLPPPPPPPPPNTTPASTSTSTMTTTSTTMTTTTTSATTTEQCTDASQGGWRPRSTLRFPVGRNNMVVSFRAEGCGLEV